MKNNGLVLVTLAVLAALSLSAYAVAANVVPQPGTQLFLSLPLAPLVFAAQDDMRSIQAPEDQPHTVLFETSGLLAGVSITIDGDKTNPGGREPLPFSITFTSPGPSTNLTTEPGSPVYFSGFPTLVSSGWVDYSLVSVSLASPFTSGASGESTTVLATYEATVVCQPASITTHPSTQPVTYGSPVTFSVAASGTTPLTYQWYKDLNLLTGATLSDYSIAAASMADAGSYHAVVSNACGSDPSNAATLTVNKADQTITFTQPASPAIYGSVFSVNPTSSSGLPVTLVASGACTGVGFDVTMTSGEGVCTLTASQAGNDNFNQASDVVRTVDAAKASQTITFDQPISPVPFLGTFDVNPTASSGLQVTVVTTGACTLRGSTVTMALPFGSCTLTASQAGNSNYSPAVDVVHIVDLPYTEVLYLPLVLHIS